MTSGNESESWEDLGSSGSEYVPENSHNNERRALYFHASSCSSDSDSDVDPNETTNIGQKRQQLCSRDATVKRRLYTEIGESSKTFNGNDEALEKDEARRNPHRDEVVRIVDYSDTSNSETDSDKTPMKGVIKTRKRKKNCQAWKKNTRKSNYQKGKQYVNAKGVAVPAKRIDTSKDCHGNCRFHCKEKFSDEIRSEIKDSYYSLDQNVKYGFLLNMTKKVSTKRKRITETNYRSFSFEYYLEKENDKLRVCKPFFLNTLCISQKPIYNVHQKKTDSGTPQSDKRGKGTIDRISKRDKDMIRQHIESFPSVDAHYCRKDSKRKYLDPSLNIQKMYELYIEMCNETQNTIPQKLSLYRNIFNFEYNLEFLQPKTDRCDICKEYRLAKMEKRIDQEMELSYQSHVSKKIIMRQERENDSKIQNPNCAVICFDLENVINLPKSEVSKLFYKQKLNVYNLTAHSSVNKEVYCAVSPETMCGRSGNDLSSAFVKILEKFVSKHPEITEIITWSDSCVPQNRNSLVSVAVADFLNRHPNIHMITMKYSVPGHSCIQVVDNIHSRIEKTMRVIDIWSPLSFVRILLKVDRRKPFCVINMKPTDFKNFKKTALLFKYDKVPYTKVCQLRFVQGEQLKVQYKINDHSSQFIAVNVNNTKITRLRKQRTDNENDAFDGNFVIAPADNLKTKSVTDTKIQHIEFAYKWMPLEDQQYMRCLISEFKNK